MKFSETKKPKSCGLDDHHIMAFELLRPLRSQGAADRKGYGSHECNGDPHGARRDRIVAEPRARRGGGARHRTSEAT